MPARDLTKTLPLEGILGSVVDAVFASDRDFRYVCVSPSAARLLGTTPEKLIGRTWDEVHPAALAKPWRDRKWRAHLRP